MRFFVPFLILLLAPCIRLRAQHFVVANEQQNLLFARVQNPIVVVLQTVSCNKTVLTTDNGIIHRERSGPDHCKFSITPSHAGLARVSVYKNNTDSRNKIGETIFRVKLLAPPEPLIGTFNQTLQSKKRLIAMGGVRAIQTGAPICVDFSVTAYKVILLRNDSMLAIIENKGAIYNPELLQRLKALQINDRIFVYDIAVRYLDGHEMKLEKTLSYQLQEE